MQNTPPHPIRQIGGFDIITQSDHKIAADHMATW